MRSPTGAVAPSTIHTDRLELRPLRTGDAAAVLEFRGDPDSTRFLSHPPLSPTENTDRLTELVHLGEASTSTLFTVGWAVVLRGSATLIGDCRTWNSSATLVDGKIARGRIEPGQASLGYILHPDYRGQGYAREAVGALITWLFTEKDIRTILAGVYEPNVASARLLRSLGFQQDLYLTAGQDQAGKGLPSLRFRLDRPVAVAKSGS